MQDVIVERLTDRTEGLRSLALLRMSVFRDWPYLYDGDDAHEEAYLREFLASEQAALILARVDDMPVGMATASPLADQPESLTGPLAAAGVEIDAGFYFGESVLLPKFRGFGIGHKFFEAREAAARDVGARHAVFCGQARPPRCPPPFRCPRPRAILARTWLHYAGGCRLSYELERSRTRRRNAATHAILAKDALGGPVVTMPDILARRRALQFFLGLARSVISSLSEQL